MLKSTKIAIIFSVISSICVTAVFGIMFAVNFFETQEKEFQNVIIAIKQESFFSGLEGKKVNLDVLEIPDMVRKTYAKQIERISDEAHQIGMAISHHKKEAVEEYVRDDTLVAEVYDKNSTLFDGSKYRKSSLLAWESYEIGNDDAYSFFCKKYLTCNEEFAKCNLEFDFSQSFPVTSYFSDSENADKINTKFEFYAFGKDYSKTIYANKALGDYDMTVNEGFLTPYAETEIIYTEEQFGSIATYYYACGFSDLMYAIYAATDY